MLSDG
jgi:large subunit ribosomal protein L14